MEMLDYPSWRWGLSLIALTLAFHAAFCCDDGYRGSEVTPQTGNPRICFVAPDPDHDLYGHSDWTAIGCCARNRVRDLGSGVFMAWRSRLAARPLFHRLDEHARRIWAHAGTTLAVDGCSGVSQRDATVRR